MSNQLPHTAIPSWSGFIYQGKVAVYHLLTLLCEDKDRDFSLQLDSLEDFAVLTGRNEIVSMHQVKALGEGGISSYKDKNGRNAFEKLKENARNRNCSNAFFHLAHKIMDKSEKDIETEYGPVKIYKYCNGSCECPPDQIDFRIEEQIRSLFLQYFSSEGWRNNSEYLKKTRIFICEIISEKVLQIHAKGQRVTGNMNAVANKEVISFAQIASILNDDLNDINEERYFLCLIRQDFCSYYEEFLKRELYGSNSDSLSKISEYMLKIESFDENTLIEFIKNICPHRKSEFKSLRQYKDCIDKDGIRDGFLKILKQLKKTQFNNDKNTYIWEVNSSRYYPTSIIHGGKSSADVCRSILENAKENDLGLMFERDNLITISMDVDSVLNEVPDVVDLINSISASGDIPKESTRITRWKNVALVSLSEAEGVINA